MSLRSSPFALASSLLVGCSTNYIAQFRAIIDISLGDSAYLIEHPYIFSIAWKAVRLLINEKTRNKVHFLDGSVDSYGPKLCEIIDESELEVDLGGAKAGYYDKQQHTLREELRRINEKK